MEKDERQKTTPEVNDSTPSAGPATFENVPDPDEDDLDDLDDMLDEFSTAKINLSEDATPKVDAQLTKVENDADVSQEAADDFNKQLQDQMAALMGNIDESPEMKWEIEAMMRELGVRADAHKTKDGADLLEGEANGSEPLSRAEEPFQKTITKTMERMQASEDHAMMAATSEDEDDILAKMLEEMQNGNSEGAADDEGFNRMLMGMMEQLTNKDILYEPMKELHDKFPAWMTKNRSSTGPDDLRRYENQQGLVAEIVEKFEQQQYSDSKAEDREFIVERMQQMQAAGSPPADLVGDMNAAQNALSDVDSGCAQQ